MEEYYCELTLLDREYPEHGLKKGAEVMMRHKLKLDKLPPPEAWKEKGFTFGSGWRKAEVEPQLPPKEAELFEQKREVAKSKFRYEEESADRVSSSGGAEKPLEGQPNQTPINYKILQYKDEED